MAEGVADTAIELQRNVRNNTRDMRESLEDLFTWEEEMKAKEKAMINSKHCQASSPPVAWPGAALPDQACGNLGSPHRLRAGGLSFEYILKPILRMSWRG